LYFLAHIAKELEGRETLLVMYRAVWHKLMTLKIPKNIEIIYLPLHSSSLKSVERL
jgi:hypothetical protein